MHMFRKSRTTHLLNVGLPVEFVKRRGRWSATSKVMERTYLRVTQDDVANQMDKLMGIKKQERKEEKEPITLCYRCNVPWGEGNFCANCGAPKDVKADYDLQKKIAKSVSDDKDAFSRIVRNIIREEIKKMHARD